MRLIDTDSLRLRSFMESEAPQYAILSHTWGEAEVSFQDMQACSDIDESLLTQKSGYHKLTDFCRRAREDGYFYAWIDTCCIDKTSSAELSEAINSMYRWYQRAHVCYVLLSDLESGTKDVENELKNCRWFTRGWCLQELIAPLHVKFFDVSWAYLGSKSDLITSVTEITNIDEAVLRWPGAASSIPVARRMSWAANRETTREEDTAYCLFGLFDVNMPLLYGEGKNAFIRLQEEIIRRSNDLSIFASGIRLSHVPDYKSPELVCGFRSMFANSPRDFRTCSTLRPSQRWTPGVAFSLTNNGLYFRRLELGVDPREGVFHFFLHCAIGHLQHVRVHLCKIGPGRYARLGGYHYASPISLPTANPDQHHSNVANPISVDNRNDNFTIMVEDVYLCINSDRTLTSHYEISQRSSILIRSQTHHLSRAIRHEVGTPISENWDPARMMFMTLQNFPLRARWIVFPSLATQRTGFEDVRLPVGSFYLVAGVNKDQDAWICLYSSTQWKGLDRGFGVVNDFDDILGKKVIGPSDDLLYYGRTIRASIYRGERNCYCIDLNL